MSAQDNGGPAFPQSVRRNEQYIDEGGFGRSRTVTLQKGGLTLRDYFAAKAMQGLIAQSCGTATVSDPSVAATYAYQVADAMLAERTERQDADQ